MKVSRHVKRAALDNLLHCADRYAFKGAGHPEDSPAIEYDYLEAINKIERLLELKETSELP